MPVMRNPQFYFKEGFCWNNLLNPNARLLKVKLKQASVNDVGSMSLISNTKLPNSFFVSLLNSNLLFDYYREFINCTVNIQINDLRQIPIIIPTKEQLEQICELFNNIYAEKQTSIDNSIILNLENKMDELVKTLYSIDV